MKVLHTADWHVGKTIKGQSRLDEHRRVLAEVVRIADAERVDVVLVVGDVYETAAPSPDAEQLVARTILDLHETGAHVVVLAGNHDHAGRFEAVRPVFGALGITVIGWPRRRDEGGVVEVRGRGGDARLALMPFCSQRAIVRSAQLMGLDAAQRAAAYDERLRRMVEHLAEGFDADAVNVVALHGMVGGARLGGGERPAQVHEDYWIGAAAFPPSAHYVALGHVHRTQQIARAAPIWYSGPPLQVDFGDERHEPAVLVVEATPGTPARVRAVPVAGSRALRTLRGRVSELRDLAGTGDDFLRVILAEQPRAGLAQEVRELLGDGVVEVRLEAPVLPAGAGVVADRRAERSPHELFAAYLASQHIADARLERLFAELLDEATR